MFTLTSTAAQQILKAAQESGAENLALRVAARMEPDGSIGYGMGFDDTGDNDMRLQIEDVAVVIAEHHIQLLEDTVLDFVELEPGDFNFIFINQREAEASAGGCASTGSSAGGCGSGGCGGGGCGSKGPTH
jgi:iron-sulfur cluster assembly protein